MTLQKLLGSPRSPIVGVSARERMRELGKTKNAIYKSIVSSKNHKTLQFSSPATYSSDRYEILIQLSKDSVKVHCSCPAFLKQGFLYRCGTLGVAIKKEDREDKRWRRYHGPSLFCKHLDLLFRNSVSLKKISKTYESFDEK